MKIYYSHGCLLAIDVIALSKVDRLMPKLTALEVKQEERRKVLERIISEMETLPEPMNETEGIAQVERVEGLLTYFVSHKLENWIQEGNWFVGVLLSASLLEDTGRRRLERKFAHKISPEDRSPDIRRNNNVLVGFRNDQSKNIRQAHGDKRSPKQTSS